jgi:hypothetical protein
MHRRPEGAFVQPWQGPLDQRGPPSDPTYSRRMVPAVRTAIAWALRAPASTTSMTSMTSSLSRMVRPGPGWIPRSRVARSARWHPGPDRGGADAPADGPGPGQFDRCVHGFGKCVVDGQDGQQVPGVGADLGAVRESGAAPTAIGSGLPSWVANSNRLIWSVSVSSNQEQGDISATGAGAARRSALGPRRRWWVGARGVVGHDDSFGAQAGDCDGLPVCWPG